MSGRSRPAWRPHRLLWLGLGLISAPQFCAGVALAQTLPPQPAPPPPVSDCVRRYGYTGCAARLYAQVLCEIIGSSVDLNATQQQLQQRFTEEQINFKGIAVEQVESAAVRYYVPQMCPEKKASIWSLMLPGEAG